MNLPNKITLTRICMIPLFILFFYLEIAALNGYNYLIAAIVFVLAASTDALDGHIARKYGLVTNMGKFLDPIADKVLVSTALILLLTRPAAFEVSFLAGWGTIFAGVCVAVILARELIVSGFRLLAVERGIVLAADRLGKIKTVLQDVSIALLLAVMPFLATSVGRGFAVAGVAVFTLAAIATVASGVNYVVRNRQVLKDEPQKREGGDRA